MNKFRFTFSEEVAEISTALFKTYFYNLTIFLEGDTESTWYVGHSLAYCTRPRWYMMSVEQSVKWELAGKTEVLGENLPQCRFVHHKSPKTWPRIEPGPPQCQVWAVARSFNNIIN
jgi:hypothetical protein